MRAETVNKIKDKPNGKSKQPQHKDLHEYFSFSESMGKKAEFSQRLVDTGRIL